MAGEGIEFGGCVFFHIDDEVDRLAISEVVGAFDGVDKVQPRDPSGWWCRIPLSGAVVGYGGIEAGIADKSTGDFVIVHVVDGRCGENDIGASPAEKLGDATSAFVIEDDGEVAKFKAGVFGLQDACSGSSFAAADAGDFGGGVFCAAAVTRGHGGDGNTAAQPAQMQ